MAKHTIPGWSVRAYGPSPGSHTHDHFQVLWGLHGELELEIDGQGSRVVAGQGLIIAPHERHDFESRQGSRCLVLDSADAGWAARQRRPCCEPATDLLARFIAEALAQDLPIDRQQAASLLAQSWGALPRPERARRDIDWDGLAAWARTQLSQPLSVSDLAARACLAESQFRARCVEALGCSPMQWLRRLRLDEAEILRARGLSVAEAARRTGYDSPSALTAALRRHGRN
ncbi:helix-turn-helix domain-containing protein [Aromatoleum petrolei]|uniref:Helix-turn-helix domain-containing protein n=1 Tax=Aromatoleum petrolei TaxID=76116 RepID=A0ABX1MJ52_9RHOO|nr:AraC family transcriptional regulator [Aromatoleum petrolei]NMF87968.1 helix-turn-helix domain-containing protein [Aromatoleum petrolei]QTQ36663.1 Putative transcriptional regulator, AraC-type [Aromatoleum petrolei]